MIQCQGCTCAGWLWEGEGGLGDHQPGVYVPLKALFLVFSSPEPLGSRMAIIRRPSVRHTSSVRPSVRPFTITKIFFSETAWPTKAKFYMKHLWEGGTNVYIRNPGHMTKMATASPEPVD